MTDYSEREMLDLKKNFLPCSKAQPSSALTDAEFNL